jgi:outer membrane protein assembly factor BamB
VQYECLAGAFGLAAPPEGRDVKIASALVVWLSLATAARGDDGDLAWPQFRGPGGSGVAEDEEPPIEIGPQKNVKWKVPVPSGLSSPIVAGNLVVLTAFEDGNLFTIAYRRADGSEAWRRQAPAKEIEEYYEAEGSPAASTPATDGERIVSYFGSCGLVCYDFAGSELWRLEMPTVKTPGNFGTGVSPILVDGTVILLRDVVKDARILAVDAATGERKWEMPRKSEVGYCTPVLWDTPDGKQIAAPGMNQMTGYDFETGEEKWHVVGMPAGVCASPVVADGELFFAAWSPGAADDTEFQMPIFDDVLKGEGGDANGDGAVSREEAASGPWKDFFDAQDTSGDGLLTRDEWETTMKFMASAVNSAFALQAGGTGDVTATHVRWKQTRGLPYVATAIVYRGQHVMVKDGGIVTAYDTQTGEEIYQKRAVANGSYYASPVAAGGNIYFTSLADGTVTVVEGGSANGRLVARNEPLGERVAATPAIADDTLFIRTAGHLYAFATDERNQR